MGPWLLTMLACFGGNKDEAVEAICEQVVSCGTYGWGDQDECEDGWLDNPDYGTECAYDSAYLACADDCLYYDCDAFEDCETYCWLSHCL